MNPSHALELRRSESFAEDVLDLLTPGPEPIDAPHLPRIAKWSVNLLPLAVAALGVAFAVVPPQV